MKPRNRQNQRRKKIMSKENEPNRRVVVYIVLPSHALDHRDQQTYDRLTHGLHGV